jgi:hypothetical protein
MREILEAGAKRAKKIKNYDTDQHRESSTMGYRAQDFHIRVYQCR